MGEDGSRETRIFVYYHFPHVGMQPFSAKALKKGRTREQQNQQTKHGQDKSKDKEKGQKKSRQLRRFPPPETGPAERSRVFPEFTPGQDIIVRDVPSVVETSALHGFSPWSIPSFILPPSTASTTTGFL
jgi:hypothetical protein